MYLEIDPHGDSLITIMDKDTQPSSPCETEMEVTLEKRYLVSKKHLMLASRRASKVLGGPFKEAIPEEDGLFHWNFESIFDSEAFEIVMHIIHGQTRHVPERVNVDLLAQIAAIVDDLECQNSIWFFAKRWLSQIQSPNPEEMSEDVMRWILISFVFEESDISRTITSGAIRYGTDIITTLGLPIRPKILEDIDEQRKYILTHLFHRLEDLQSKLLEKSLGCSQGCRAMMYGTLTQGMKSNSWLPLPIPPYISLSISSALEQLKAVKGVDYYCPLKEDEMRYTGAWRLESRPPPRELNNFYPYYHRPTEGVPSTLVRHNCRIEDRLRTLLTITEGRIKGLELSYYLNTQVTGKKPA